MFPVGWALACRGWSLQGLNPTGLKPVLLNTMPFILESTQMLKDFVGREIATSGWLAVTQERIQQFADATGDRQWIHVDPERAQRESPYGATIAHGFLTLSLMSSLMNEAIQLPGDVRQTINYGLNRVRFPATVRAGEKIRARVRLHSCRELPGSVEATYEITVETEGGDKPCCVAEWILRYFS